ncbi:MAG: tRNA dihydrouridine(20/20a) synthase DusA [Gammaproteobacteria bacterium]
MNTATPAPHRLCVAPMLDWTTPACRYFLRLICRRAFLYTEMIASAALTHGDATRLLAFHPHEHPVAAQFGGSDPAELARCAAQAAALGYDEVNLNVGCPSDRVQSGRFGACLMAEPALVARCVAAMRQAGVPVTVKTRLGIDDLDSYDFLAEFIGTVRAAGCATFVLHARKAYLSGLSPRENREVPPLMYERVHRVKREFPDLEIVLNGGITTLDEARRQLVNVDGVMIGREAYRNPWLLAQADRDLFDATAPIPTRLDVLDAYRPYLEQRLREGARLPELTRHLLGLFQGQPGARAWRRHLSTQAPRAGSDAGIIDAALREMQRRPAA